MIAAVVGIVELLWFLPLFLRQGKTDAAHKRYIIFSILIGMTLGIVLATILGVGGILKKVLGFEENSIGAVVISSFLTAAVPEEISKFFCGWLMLKYAKPTRKLDYIFIIGGAGLGFGITESMMYATSGVTAIIRILEPLHLMWQFRMGERFYKFVQAKRSGDKIAARKNLMMTFLIPILMHGVHDCFSLGTGAFSVTSSTGEIPAMTIVFFAAALLWNIGMVVFSILTEKRVAEYVRESRSLDSAVQ